MENSTIKDRLMQFIKAKSLSFNKFEKTIGLGNGFCRNMEKGMTTDKLRRILEAFPDLNIEWLVCGIGEMLRTQGETMQAETAEGKTIANMAAIYQSERDQQAQLIQQLMQQNKELMQIIADQLAVMKGMNPNAAN